jgi:hypothetical protein
VTIVNATVTHVAVAAQLSDVALDATTMYKIAGCSFLAFLTVLSKCSSRREQTFAADFVPPGNRCVCVCVCVCVSECVCVCVCVCVCE